MRSQIGTANCYWQVRPSRETLGLIASARRWRVIVTADIEHDL
jgi:hypothetical protein